MRIAIDARMLEALYTGVGRYTKNLINALRNIDDNNQYILIVRNDSTAKLHQSKNLKIVKWHYRPYSLKSILSLHKLVTKERIDLFHSPYCVIPLFTKCPVIVTIHDLMAITYPRFFSGRKLLARILGRVYFRLFITLSIKKATAVITVSNQIKNDLINLIPDAQYKTSVVYEGVEECFTQKVESEKTNLFRKKCNLRGRAILYLGSTRPHKNLPRLVRSFYQLTSLANFDCQLIVAGEKDRNLSVLQDLITGLGISNRVVFLNPLSGEELVLLMNSVDIFVFPSLYEGFGLPTLEAMACGIPVVASNAASIPEVVGDAALLVNPEDEDEIAKAMFNLLTDNRLRQKLIEKGFERVRYFTWEKAAKETLRIYNKVTDNELRI